MNEAKRLYSGKQEMCTGASMNLCIPGQINQQNTILCNIKNTKAKKRKLWNIARSSVSLAENGTKVILESKRSIVYSRICVVTKEEKRRFIAVKRVYLNLQSLAVFSTYEPDLMTQENIAKAKK